MLSLPDLSLELVNVRSSFSLFNFFKMLIYFDNDNNILPTLYSDCFVCLFVFIDLCPVVNGPGKDRTGDEEEQTDMVMDMWLGEKRPTGSREF